MRSTILFIFATAGLCTFLAAPAGAQHLPPRMEPYRMSDSLLPVLDDFGVVIPERMIQERLSSGGGARLGAGLLGAVAGWAIGVALSSPPGNPDCTRYEPCSDREKYYKTTLPQLGFVVGILVMGVIPDWETDRFDVIKRIRAERRLRQGGLPR